MAAALPWGRPLTCADLEDIPDDGHRYELIDGALVATPAPDGPHQVVAFALARLLWEWRPAELTVLPAPIDWAPEPTTVLQPDVVVVDREEAAQRRLTLVPHLVVEVLSASTRRHDLGSKRLAYAAAGVPAYWVVDPEPPVTLTVLHLQGRSYAQVARASGEEAYRATVPFEVTVVPARLADL